jgi:hypothetical protein
MLVCEGIWPFFVASPSFIQVAYVTDQKTKSGLCRDSVRRSPKVRARPVWKGHLSIISCNAVFLQGFLLGVLSQRPFSGGRAVRRKSSVKRRKKRRF